MTGATALRRRWSFLAGIFVCASAAGCHTMSNSAKGTLLGSGAGAIAGAVIGHQTGHRDAGALLGTLGGGLTGALVGNEMDVREERDAAVEYSRHLEQAIVSESKGLTNYDLARLTASGASDEVVIAAVRSHGGNFDLSPGGIIQLKALGVSDRVILAVQQFAAAPPMLTTVPAATPAKVASRPPDAPAIDSRRPWWRRVESHDAPRSIDHPAR